MKENYTEVPNIISSKDLDYLSDMFTWNYGAYKNVLNSSNSVNDEDIKKMLSFATNSFHGTMVNILNILNNGGNDE